MQRRLRQHVGPQRVNRMALSEHLRQQFGARTFQSAELVAVIGQLLLQLFGLGQRLVQGLAQCESCAFQFQPVPIGLLQLRAEADPDRLQLVDRAPSLIQLLVDLVLARHQLGALLDQIGAVGGRPAPQLHRSKALQGRAAGRVGTI